MANGMFDGLVAQERADERDLLTLAQMDPFQQAGHAALVGSKQAGTGLGKVAAGMAGRDARSPQERLQSAMKAIGEMGDTDLNTPDGVDTYYKGVINVLRQNGLPAEAHRAAQEWNEHKNKNADRQVKLDEIARKREADQRNAAIKEEANRIKAKRTQQLAQQGMPEFIQLVDRAESMQPGPMRTAFLDRINQQAGGKIKLEEAGDRVIVRNERGDILGIDMVGEKPMAEKPMTAQQRFAADEKKKALAPAYQASMVAAQTDYKAAADLYNHPGLDNLIGKYSGIAAERGTDKDGLMREAAIAALSPEGQEALALFQQVQGGAFVRALQDLKTAGGGSTGLGQVTEIEGQKITAAKGALFPRQQPASFRRKLADYISVIEQSANILAGKAQEDGLDPIHLSIVELTGPTRGVAPKPAATAPRAAPGAPAPAAGGDRVRVMRPDGQPGTIPRAKLQEYIRKGYKEIK